MQSKNDFLIILSYEFGIVLYIWYNKKSIWNESVLLAKTFLIS